MDGDIKIFRITDYSVALHVTRHPALEDVLLEDGEDPWIPDLLNEYWIGASYEDNVAGCFRINKMGKVMYQIHTYFIPGYRRHVQIAAHLVGKWILENLPELTLLVAMIPACFENVIKHAKRRGFLGSGRLPHAFLRNKKLEDICLLSISRGKMTEIIEKEEKTWAQSSVR